MQILAKRAGNISWVAAVMLLAVCACAAGCVQRRMTVRTNPPGALLYVDDYECGTTPTSINFTYYGTRKIRLVKDNYETLTVMQPMSPPWYEITPIDFISENLVPATIHDRHEFEFTLKPQVVVPPEQLLGKAEELRRNTQAGATVAPRPPRLVRPPYDAPRPRGTTPVGIAPATTLPPSAVPAGTMPPGATPMGTVPMGAMPPGAMPSAPPGVPPAFGSPAPLGSQPIYPLPQ